MPYQAPVQAVQHVPIQHVPIQHVPYQHPAEHVQLQVPVQEHIPVQEHVQVHVQRPQIPPTTRQIVSVQKTIVKEVAVPYPVDRYVKVDRHIAVPVDRYVRVDRPYEVIKYVQEPYIVRVERPYHVIHETKVSVPKPEIEIEPVVEEPQHIVKEVVHHEEKAQELPAPQAPQNEYLPPSPAQPQNEYIPPQQHEQASQPQNEYIPPQEPETKQQFVPPPPPPLPQPLPRPQPQSQYLPPRH